MFQTMVAPLDGSRSAQHAFDFTLASARSQGANLEVCSVVDPVGMFGHAPLGPLEEKRFAAAKDHADLIVKEAVKKGQAAGFKAEGTVLVGDPAPEIVALAARTGADVVIMGTHGRSGFKRLFMGSVAEAVLRSSPCPVAIVRERAHVRSEHSSPPVADQDSPIFVMRLIEVAPEDFERIYGEIATFMQGPCGELPGCIEADLLGSEDATRIVIVAEFRSRADWAHAQWDARLGEFLEEIAANSQTLDFNLYRGDRFLVKRTRQ